MVCENSYRRPQLACNWGLVVIVVVSVHELYIQYL